MIIQNRQDLARAIKSAAARQGVTVSKIGASMGVSLPSISRTINKGDISIGTLQSIAAGMGCALSVDFVPVSSDGTPGGRA